MLADVEIGEVARAHPGSRALTGAQATVANTLDGLDGASVAHMAAHGHHERENVLFSCLELVDGPLMAYDIEQLTAAPRASWMPTSALRMASSSSSRCLRAVVVRVVTSEANAVSAVRRRARRSASAIAFSVRAARSVSTLARVATTSASPVFREVEAAAQAGQARVRGLGPAAQLRRPGESDDRGMPGLRDLDRDRRVAAAGRINGQCDRGRVLVDDGCLQNLLQ
jgi:hypothetical protein